MDTTMRTACLIALSRMKMMIQLWLKFIHKGPIEKKNALCRIFGLKSEETIIRTNDNLRKWRTYALPGLESMASFFTLIVLFYEPLEEIDFLPHVNTYLSRCSSPLGDLYLGVYTIRNMSPSHYKDKTYESQLSPRSIHFMPWIGVYHGVMEVIQWTW